MFVILLLFISFNPSDILIFCRLTNILPVDVVYTWVNGSDPVLIEGLLKIEQKDMKCPLSHCVPAPYIAMEYVFFIFFIRFGSYLSVNSRILPQRPNSRLPWKI